METSSPEALVRKLLEPADVLLNGSRPWDIKIRNPHFFDRVLSGGSLALGESYMDGWWDCEALDQFFDRIMRARLDRKTRKHPRVLWGSAKVALTSVPRRSKAFEIGKRHYDIGNDLFCLMLDKGMNYSCAYWKDAKTLDEAQKAKLRLICRKFSLQPGMTVLDIGCGWGGFAAYAARKFGVKVLGITVSREQVKLARERCRGLPVTIELRDYRDVEGHFDRIVSIGMFEHVGAGSYRTFMRVIRRCLAPEGLFLLHTIAGNRSVRSGDPWVVKYIFPHSMLPSARQIASAAESRLVLEDWHSFGPHYDPTLMAWHRNFTQNWHYIQNVYDQRFFRMWTYYLLSFAGCFRARRLQLWQIVFSRDGIRQGYQSIR